MSDSPTDTVINDRYEIRSRIGRGGMASVYLASDRLLDRQVAIKVLFPEFAVDPHFVERFRREAQAAANVTHPNIVNVYDWGRYETTYFIAMEYVHGRTLAEILKANDRLTPKQAAEIASEVAAALGFAHEGGLAHRDIKPANILIGTNGQVKVADFGIARAMNAGTENQLTQAGSVMGTAAYFSPEQAQGAQPDPRSDLYSLGIVMYEMVAGKPPFAGENAVAIAYKQVHDQPQPLNRVIDGVPRSFEAIVAKLLAKDPDLRYSSAHELREDIRRFLSGETVQALVAAAAGSAGGKAVAPEVATVAIDATPVGTTQAMSPQARQAQRNEAQRTAVQRTASQQAAAAARPAYRQAGPASAPPHPNDGAFPPGAAPDAAYYAEHQNRTGWYALAAFLALIALVAGGFWLYQEITDEGDQTAGVVLDDYVGFTLDEAIEDLRTNGLNWNPVSREDVTIPENEVTGTDPVAGTTVVRGQTITLYYNPSKNLQKVPDVTNQPYADAVQTLKASGFAVLEPAVSEESENVPVEHVVRTEPAAETAVPAGSEIIVFVSSGPNQVAIPGDIINMAFADAKSLLESADYQLVVLEERRVDAQVPEGQVIESKPPVNTYVDRGSQVTLVVSDGPGRVEVPELRGLTEAQAQAALAQVSLVGVGSVKDLPPNDPSDGLVVEQNRAPGDSVEVGSTVEYAVGLAADPPETTVIVITTEPTTTSTTSTTTAPTSTSTATGG